MMTDNFFTAFAAILLLPVIPSYVLYKFLPPSDTDVSGPYKGLSVKLKGAFGGYFLLVLVGAALHFVVTGNGQQRRIEDLEARLNTDDSTIAHLKTQIGDAVTDWLIKGIVLPGGKEGTRFFYDDGTITNEPDGSFELIKRTIGKEGATKPPKWMCVYNPVTGYRVISLNREISHPDIAAYNILFNDAKHEIMIKKPIQINSNENDSIVAVSNFIEKNPALKEKVLEADPGFIKKAAVIKQERQTDKSRLWGLRQLEKSKTLPRAVSQ